MVYYDIRNKFGLSAQLTIRVIGKVVDTYLTDRSAYFPMVTGILILPLMVLRLTSSMLLKLIILWSYTIEPYSRKASKGSKGTQFRSTLQIAIRKYQISKKAS